MISINFSMKLMPNECDIQNVNTTRMLVQPIGRLKDGNRFHNSLTSTKNNQQHDKLTDLETTNRTINGTVYFSHFPHKYHFIKVEQFYHKRRRFSSSKTQVARIKKMMFDLRN